MYVLARGLFQVRLSSLAPARKKIIINSIATGSLDLKNKEERSVFAAFIKQYKQ